MILFGGRLTTYISANLSSISSTGQSINSACSSLNYCNYPQGSCKSSINSTSASSCQCVESYSGLACEFFDFDSYSSELWIYSVESNRFYLHTGDPAGTFTPVPWPDERYLHSSVVLEQNIVVYGGYSQLCQDYCSGVWEYTWNPLDPLSTRGTWYYYTSPSDAGPRWQHSATVYKDPNYGHTDTMFIFGGHRENEYLNDLWQYIRYPTRQWVKISSTGGPTVRMSMAASALPQLEWYFYGGWTYNTNWSSSTGRSRPSNKRISSSDYFLSDFWSFNFNSSTWHKIEQPPPPSGESLSNPPELMGARGYASPEVFFIFGGYANNRYYDDLWRYNFTSGYWSLHSSLDQTPSVRSEHSIVFFDYNLPSGDRQQYFLLFGGWGSSSSGGQTIAETLYNDLWKFDLNVCPDNCNGHGTCNFAYCFCDEGYWGTDCQNMACPSSKCSYDVTSRRQTCSHCNNLGSCYLGSCICSEGSVGLSCLNAYCPASCSGVGDCLAKGSGFASGFQCSCPSRFYGSDCSSAVCTTDCNAALGYGECSQSSGKCQCLTTSIGRYAGESCSTFIPSSALSTISNLNFSFLAFIFLLHLIFHFN